MRPFGRSESSRKTKFEAFQKPRRHLRLQSRKFVGFALHQNGNRTLPQLSHGSPLEQQKGIRRLFATPRRLFVAGRKRQSNAKLQKHRWRTAEKNAIINYYPEHALWQQYEKPRPLKSGAFRMAANFQVPVLPLFITFEGKHKRPVVNILSAILPDETLPPRLLAEQMQNQCAEVWKKLYENVYGQKLRYETEGELLPLTT